MVFYQASTFYQVGWSQATKRQALFYCPILLTIWLWGKSNGLYLGSYWSWNHTKRYDSHVPTCINNGIKRNMLSPSEIIVTDFDTKFNKTQRWTYLKCCVRQQAEQLEPLKGLSQSSRASSDSELGTEQVTLLFATRTSKSCVRPPWVRLSMIRYPSRSNAVLPMLSYLFF